MLDWRPGGAQEPCISLFHRPVPGKPLGKKGILDWRLSHIVCGAPARVKQRVHERRGGAGIEEHGWSEGTIHQQFTGYLLSKKMELGWRRCQFIGAEYLEGGWDTASCGRGLLVLIPKNENLESIKQFRPISLCNVSFKLVTTVLMNMLKHILA